MTLKLFALLSRIACKRVPAPRAFSRRLAEQLFEDRARLASIFLIYLRPDLIDELFEKGCHIWAGRDVEALQPLIAVEVH